MKKIAILLIVGILIGSTIGAVGIQNNMEHIQSASAHITTPALQARQVDNDEYLSLHQHIRTLRGDHNYQPL